MRILSIDGGGVRGVVPSAVLAYWENELKFESPDRFDLYAGTSTGAIVAAGLAMGLPARRILTLFQERAGTIFSREGLKFLEKALTFKGWAMPAYSSEALRETLVEAFGDATLGDCPKPLSIACLDVVTGGTRIFRSGQHPNSVGDRNVTLVDAVIASTAAPTFFPSAQVAGSSYVDGALWANNPAMISLLDARDLTQQSGFDGFRIVSLGCGRPFWGKPVGFGENRGLVGWGLPLMVLMMAAQSDGVHGYVRRLLPSDAYLRVDPQLPKELSALDEPDNIASLMARAGEAARDTLGAVQRFIAD
ncbi:CBASS cGAMP-activated phospholipase [Fimbriimonas ginsengisoli]|uniref:Patatin n=1 Tax=Fimbriimonas ginsengisoli Gsoil 348 TaxID=661478 RepID=A0A068NL59_FIMGI|nr:CBASS cGAMP-activated phospholipase [Fimbriimonas ginsengisoli]AIE84147.1 Patatin [Fimbriimonas ginsengisoli Gsoil 348]